MASLIGAVACGTSPPPASPAPDLSQVPVSIEFRLTRSAPVDASVMAMVHSTGDTVYLSPEAEIDNQHIARAEAVEHPSGLYVKLWLTEAGRRPFAEVKAEHIGEHMAVLINQIVLGPHRSLRPARRGHGRSEYSDAADGLASTGSGPGQAVGAAVARTWPTATP
jgi:hypothetical protein